MTSMLIFIGVLLLLGLMLMQLFHLDRQKEEKDQIHAYDNIAKRNAALRLKNKVWEREWDGMQRFAKVAREAETDKDYETALEYNLKAYEYGHLSKILTINNYAHSIDRAIINYGKLKRIDELKEFLQKVIEQYPNERSTQDWIVRLTKINQAPVKKEKILDQEEPVTLEVVMVDSTLGEKIQKLKDQFPEFDFYHNKPDDVETQQFLMYNNPVPRELTKAYSETRWEIARILNAAKVCENGKQWNQAIDIHSKFVDQKIENKIPYERLMIIYRKLKRKDQEIDIIEKGINFFRELKENNLDYVLGLAKKYGKTDFAMEYINSGQRIQYYGGVFDLYNPFTFLEKWEERLEKLKKFPGIGI